MNVCVWFTNSLDVIVVSLLFKNVALLLPNEFCVDAILWGKNELV